MAAGDEQAGAVLTAEAKPIGDRIVYLLYAAGGFGLPAVVLSIAAWVLFRRSRQANSSACSAPRSTWPASASRG